MVSKFLRRDSSRHSKLGHLRKKLQKWRRPTGRDNKMREKRRGYPKVVSIGYSKDKSLRGTIDGKKPVVVKNIKELEMAKDKLVVIGNVGKKKKIEIVKKAKEKGIKIYNVNEKKFLKKIEKKKEEKKEKTDGKVKPKVKEKKEINKEKISEPKGEVKLTPKGVPSSKEKKDINEEGKK